MTDEPKKKRPGRWKAGQSGNPAGRPAGVGEVSKVRAAIAERIPLDYPGHVICLEFVAAPNALKEQPNGND